MEANGVGIDIDRLISERARSIDASGIRRVLDLEATMKDPIDLSIGQPDFPVPDEIKKAAQDAIEDNQNGYTATQGIPALRRAACAHLVHDLGWRNDLGEPSAPTQAIVTSGTSGGLFLAFMSLLDEGDEVIVPDPYFVAYPNMPRLGGAKVVTCDTYPDFRMTAERIEPLITERTKAVLNDSPSNPCGVVLTSAEWRDVLELCRSRGVLLISDEIYDEFTYEDHREKLDDGRLVCPSAGRFPDAEHDMLVIRGFGKTYGCTGWRMGYAAGPAPVIAAMTRLQQYSYVCAPAPLQHGCLASFGVDMREMVTRFAHRREMVLAALGDLANVARPGGAFYAFVEVPRRLGMSGQEFFQAGVERNVLTIPGNAFSNHDTHFRLSFAVHEERLARGLEILAAIMRGE